MASFVTFNQFDKRFSDFEKINKDRSACPLFGLLTCYNFMNSGDLSQKTHENNIYAAVTNYMTVDIPKYLLFEELAELSTLNPGAIGVTTPELITTGVMGYDSIFKLGSPQNYCVLVLKNRNFIAILCKHDDSGETFAVRDCHENSQYNFKTFDELRLWLNKTYQFEQMTIVDGVMIPEFGNIEYLVIDEPFELVNVDPDLVDDTVEEVKIDSEKEPEKESVSTSQANHMVDTDYAFALALQFEDDDVANQYVDFI